MSWNYKKTWNKIIKPAAWKDVASFAVPALAPVLEYGRVKGMFGGGGKDPTEDANKKLDDISKMEKGIYNPYVENGQNAYENLSKQYGAMNKDPASYLENMMKGYTPSTGFDFRKNQALQASANDAAAGGTRGGSLDVQNQAGLANKLMSQDMQNWLQNTMGAQQYGMQGQQGIYDTGYKAASGLGSDLSNIAGSQAYNAYQSQQDQKKSNNDMWSNIAGLGGTALGWYFGGPVGGAAGGTAGRELGKQFAG